MADTRRDPWSAKAGPSGIGLARGGPKVRFDAALFAKAMKSADWTKTPDGLLYKSCVHQVPPGATLVAARNEIVFKNGKVHTFAPCPYPRLVAPCQTTVTPGHATARPATPPVFATTSGWLQASVWNPPAALGYLSVSYETRTNEGPIAP